MWCSLLCIGISIGMFNNLWEHAVRRLWLAWEDCARKVSCRMSSSLATGESISNQWTTSVRPISIVNTRSSSTRFDLWFRSSRGQQWKQSIVMTMIRTILVSFFFLSFSNEKSMRTVHIRLLWWLGNICTSWCDCNRTFRTHFNLSMWTTVFLAFPIEIKLSAIVVHRTTEKIFHAFGFSPANEWYLQLRRCSRSAFDSPSFINQKQSATDAYK